MLLDLFFPKHCLNCNTIGSYVCQSCTQTLQRHNQICIVCRQRSSWGETHKHCQKYSHIHHLIIACIYKDTLKKAIHKIKYKYAYDIIEELCQKVLCSEKIKQFLTENQIDLITEVPLHPHKQNARGFNLPTYLAKWIHNTYQIPHISLLEKTTLTQAQVKLNRYDRLFNMKDRYQMKTTMQLVNKRILLVDDVLTTGATLESAAQVLSVHKAAQITGLVLGSSH